MFPLAELVEAFLKGWIQRRVRDKSALDSLSGVVVSQSGKGNRGKVKMGSYYNKQSREHSQKRSLLFPPLWRQEVPRKMIQSPLKAGEKDPFEG